MGDVTFDLTQAALYLGVSRPTLRIALRDGTIPAIKIGTRYIISKTALDQMMGVRMVPLPPPIEIPDPAVRR
jgi:excisionase family DNA binding protein